MEWLAAADERTLHVSVVSVGELRRGIERVRDPRRRADLEAFLSALRARLGPRVLAFDAAVAERCGRLTARLAAAGRTAPAIDSLIAATALEHDLTMVTRNAGDFAGLEVPVVNPFD
jgi:hypothetical protein